MKNLILLLSFLFSFSAVYSAEGADYLISTPNTSLLLSGKKGERLLFRYYGTRINSPADVYNSGTAIDIQAYPSFGIECVTEPAVQVTHADGNMSLDLYLEDTGKIAAKDGETYIFILKDPKYPFTVKLCYKIYSGTDVIEVWTEISHREKKPVTLYKFASAFLPVRQGDHWLTHLHGNWASESYQEEERLLPGMKMLKNKDGVRNSQTDNPSFMLSVDGYPREDSGAVLGGSLAWSGNYALRFDIDYTRTTRIIAGINEDASYYKLSPGENFVTPPLAITYSIEGKGGVSRNFHRWARKYKLAHGDKNRDILLNSWEGVYFDVNQTVMEQMMKDFSDIGGELFVMDDGWFGNKYPRNNDTKGLGDWEVCREKLPGGIEGLIASADKNHIKFGIWIEPEMINTLSELYEKHPHWIICQDNREAFKGRGGTQLVLDMSNPEVQDFVFGVVDKLLTAHPEIKYIKWDANMSLFNYGSSYLPQDKQSHLYIDYHRGLLDVLQKIRFKYPEVAMQACASGGGRVNYGLLPYFDEFWPSDNTDALQRVYIQWGFSDFYPAVAMASHVSAGRNHQTGRSIPLKFRFDVAMSGRLGMEMQPADMTADEKEFAREAIASYKIIRPVVQQGDLYRLISPYDRKGVSSLMYVTPEKDEAVFFAYKLEHFYNQPVPRFRMAGLDPNRKYKLEELNRISDGLPQEGKVISGKYLMEEGIDIPLYGEYSSKVIRIISVN